MGRKTKFGLFHQLQIERDAHSVHQNHALIDQLLVGDFVIRKLPQRLSRADEFDGLGRTLRPRSKLVQHSEIE